MSENKNPNTKKETDVMVKTKILVISSDPAMLGFLQQNLGESGGAGTEGWSTF